MDRYRSLGRRLAGGPRAPGAAEISPGELAVPEEYRSLASQLARPPVGAGEYGLPYMPPLPEEGPSGGEVRSAQAPPADMVPDESGGSIDTGNILARMLAGQSPETGRPRVPISGASGPNGEPVYASEGKLVGPDTRPSWYRAIQPYDVNPPATIQGLLMSTGMTGGPSRAVTGAVKHIGERAADTLGKYPRLAAMLAGSAAAASPSEAGGPADAEAQAVRTAGQQLFTERARLQQDLDAAKQRREAARPKGRAPDTEKDPIFTEAQNEVSKLEVQKSANDELVKQHTYRNSPEYALAMKERAETQERAAREKRAATPTRELFSDYTPYLPYIAGGLALVGGAATKGRSIHNFNTEIADISTRLQKALDTAKTAPRGSIASNSAIAEARGLSQEYQTLKAEHAKFFDPGTKKAMALGGALGFEQAYLPEETDLARASLGSPLWGSLKKDFFDEWPTTIARGVLSTGIGAGLGHIGGAAIEPFMSRPLPPGYGPAADALPQPYRPRVGGPRGPSPSPALPEPTPAAPAPMPEAPTPQPRLPAPPATAGAQPPAALPAPEALPLPSPTQSRAGARSSFSPATSLPEGFSSTPWGVRGPGGRFSSHPESSQPRTPRQEEVDPATEYFTKNPEGKLLRGSDAGAYGRLAQMLAG
jgi:hypothetical protein